MIILAHGTDEYRTELHGMEIAKRHQKKYPSGYNLTAIHADDPESLEKLDLAVRTHSFFQEIRCVIFDKIQNLKNPVEVLEFCKKHDISKQNDIVLVGLFWGDPSRSSPEIKKLWTYLATHAHTTKEFSVMTPHQTAIWA